MTADIPRHLFQAATEQGPHICAHCPLGETNEVHHVPTIEAAPERYEVTAGEDA